MSVGGFTSLVQIKLTKISGGFGDGGKPYTDGKMELEGRLLELDFGDIRGRINKSVEASTRIDISFTESHGRIEGLKGGANAYIGTIHLNKSGSNIYASAKLVLPVAMFHQISVFGEKEFIFDTIHDKVEKPSEREQADHIIAYVKRAYFQRSLT